MTDEAARLIAKEEGLVTDRRNLHQIPELDFDLPLTLDYVRARLTDLRGTVFEPAPASLCIYFDAGADTTIAYRADMDALPVTEATGQPYASRHPGRMHACGHDGHMAMLLGLCDHVSENLESLRHNVLAIFQPAEETVGGARPICETGVMQEYGVDAVFGLHMWPGFPPGQIVSRPGELMARSCEVTVDIEGKSVHIAKASTGADALYAAALLVDEVHRLTEEMPPGEHHLLNFGLLRSGEVRNAISGYSHLEGTLRAFSDEVFDHLVTGLQHAAKASEEATGCTVNIHMTDGYPAVVNDAALFAAVQEHVAEPVEILSEPQMTGEDFSFYQREAPGVFFFVGTGRADALHSPTFDMDEAALSGGLELLISLLDLPLPEGP